INFADVVYKLLENREKITGIKPKLVIGTNIEWHNISDIIKVNLYRIIQEALQNCVKYSMAKSVHVGFQLCNNSLEMVIKDDGKGFNVKKTKYGIGIKNMKSRAEKINGNFYINSD